jgi:hypothetical protein
MKRPSGLTLGVIVGIVALVVTEIIVWWPEEPKKRTEEPSAPPAPVVVPKATEPPPAPTAAASAPAARPGRTIQQLRESENDEIRRLEGCADKKCGDPCIFRCESKEDGRCVDGKRPGACSVDGVCSTTLPAMCPGPGESPP